MTLHRRLIGFALFALLLASLAIVLALDCPLYLLTSGSGLVYGLLVMSCM